MNFYPGIPLSQETLDELAKIVDDGTTDVFIDTPEGWKCEKEGCNTDYKHTHGSFPSLKTSEWDDIKKEWKPYIQ
jgi:hypothetical protein